YRLQTPPTGGEIIPESRGAIISEQRGGFIGIGSELTSAVSNVAQDGTKPDAERYQMLEYKYEKRTVLGTPRRRTWISPHFSSYF
ncbi:hypothetical protein, partial [Sinorhizobium meliloti]|uniref:hypothetical protein n=1 Tax=Rhizobium meliloti TaxID=382 RepID=UPI001AECC799